MYLDVHDGCGCRSGLGQPAQARSDESDRCGTDTANRLYLPHNLR